MPQIASVLICAVVMCGVWTLAGLPLARRLSPSPLPGLLAPAIGYAVFNVVALPLFRIFGMSRGVVLATAILMVAVAAVACIRQRPSPTAPRERLLLLAAIAMAILVAAGPLTAVLPKTTADGVTLASPIFDHSKVALIDEIVRAGVPPSNPFFSETGVPDRIAYYYLWHFGAAAMAVLTGVSGWESDAALTWFTGFAFLMTAMALAIRLGGRIAAAFLVIALAVPASSRFLFELIWPAATAALLGPRSGLGGWLFQTSWAPQHVASATCVVLACALLHQLPQRGGWIATVTIGLVAAAGFQSSAWVGGIVFAIAATAIASFLLATSNVMDRRSFLLRAAVAGTITVALSASFIVDQVALTALRGGGAPVVISPVEVLGDTFPERIRRPLDLAAYWLTYLPIEFPVVYPAGLIGLIALLRDRHNDPDRRDIGRTLALLTVASLLAAWLLRSVVGDNNDLGWRAVLPAAMVLAVFAAAAIARWPGSPARICAALAIVGAIFAAPDTVAVLNNNVFGSHLTSARAFVAAPALWAAGRRHSGKTERIANNPLALADMTPWPANISWALLANRRSCYAGKELAVAFAPIPAERRDTIEAQFVRVFAGEAAAGDVEQLASRFHCDVIVVTAQDGAWKRDPFAASNIYRLMETQPEAWRIYRRVNSQ